MNSKTDPETQWLEDFQIEFAAAMNNVGHLEEIAAALGRVGLPIAQELYAHVRRLESSIEGLNKAVGAHVSEEFERSQHNLDEALTAMLEICGQLAEPQP